jgi:hypothetical protein
MGKLDHANELRLARTQERADILFVMYWQMGPDRSMERLSETCTKLGLRGCSLNTLKRYSVAGDWQRRVLELTVKAREEREADSLKQVEDMNKAHINAHRALMGLALAGINKRQDELRKTQEAGKGAMLDIDYRDIVAMLRQAQVGERLARGEATSRTEVLIEVISTFVNEFALIFKAVNQFLTPEEREREYVRRFDEMLREYYSQITAPAIKQIQGGANPNYS